MEELEDVKKTTVYLPRALSDALRLLAFQMYSNVGDMLRIAAEEKYGACIEEGKDTNFGPRVKSANWEQVHDQLTELRQSKLFARRARRRGR